VEFHSILAAWDSGKSTSSEEQCAAQQNYPPEALNFTLHGQRNSNASVERSTVHREKNVIEFAPASVHFRSTTQRGDAHAA
jgi:hypothetical protein